MKKKGRLFIISGPSGAGKSTLINNALEKLDNFVKSLSVTTRPMRKNEMEKKHYRFISEKDFRAMVENKKLLEWAEYCGYLYGTPKDFVFNNLEKGKNVILEIEVKGAMQVKEKIKDSYMIFIRTYNLEELKKRLLARETDKEEEIERRLEIAEEETRHQKYYDCIIVNNNYNESLLNLEKVLKKEADC